MRQRLRRILLVAMALLVCAELAACSYSEDKGVAYSSLLGSEHYYNIAAENNLFPASPTVTSDESNPGDVDIRVLDGKGQLVGGSKTVSPGMSVVLDEIPAFSGTCTIQGKAVETDGTYKLYID